MKILKKFSLGRNKRFGLSLTVVALLLSSILILTSCGDSKNQRDISYDEIIMSFTSSQEDEVYSSRGLNWKTSLAESNLYYCEGKVNQSEWDALDASSIISIQGEKVESSYYDNSSLDNRFEAEITGLSPGDYTYRISLEDGLSSPYSFNVPSETDPTEFIFIGDVQPENDLDDYDIFGDILDTAIKNHPDIAFALQVGDLVNTVSAVEEWDALMSRATRLFTSIPFMTAVGNHEITTFKTNDGDILYKPVQYLDRFSLPQNGPEGLEEEFYSFDYGSVHITVLCANYMDPQEAYSNDENENILIGETVKEWIENDITSSTKPWKIVMLHQPILPIVGDSTTIGLQTEWLPIMERTGVDLILCGHQHEFVRSVPWMASSNSDNKGFVQIMANSSKKTYPASGDGVGYLEFELGGVAGYHFISATDSTLAVEAFDSKGKSIDYWYSEK